MKRVAILGSTGSIGKTTLDIIKQHKKEFVLEALTANNNIAALKKQIAEFRPRKVAVVDGEAGCRLRSEANIKRGIYSGTEGLCRIASDEEVDVVVLAISGSAALGPLLAAINAGKTIALANKEALVMAGEIIMRRLKNSRARIIPVDSEQSAIFQCLEGREHAELRRVYLTASGGPLYNVPLNEFSSLSREEILAHPRWKMGRKITVDSATMMNKGLEVIEARWLFDIDVSAIGVLIHRQAIIHSMVEFLDGIVLAQLGVTDMALPIQYALSYPRRLPNEKYNLNFLKVGQLSFEKADTGKFPCLDFAYRAAKDSGSAPAAMNAANEEAVKAFLDKGI
jgi:1-deoxy-D-xylulose-5-phosphate reductoisomerase